MINEYVHYILLGIRMTLFGKEKSWGFAWVLWDENMFF